LAFRWPVYCIQPKPGCGAYIQVSAFVGFIDPARVFAIEILEIEYVLKITTHRWKRLQMGKVLVVFILSSFSLKRAERHLSKMKASTFSICNLFHLCNYCTVTTASIGFNS
jgi:hypothetical protein